jgi:hypothetical protein
MNRERAGNLAVPRIRPDHPQEVIMLDPGYRLAIRLVTALACAVGPGAALRAEGILTVTQDPRSPVMPRARDGSIAIQEELDAARRAGTREAYDLFIARHPDHPLATTARQERDRLK